MERVVVLRFAEGAPPPKWWALAWFNRGTGEEPSLITLRWRLLRWVFLAPSRLGHELTHWDGTGTNAGDHHPFWHFCIRSPIALRLFWIHATRTRKEVGRFQEFGRLAE